MSHQAKQPGLPQEVLIYGPNDEVWQLFIQLVPNAPRKSSGRARRLHGCRPIEVDVTQLGILVLTEYPTRRGTP